jgi:hypothetical protein
MKAKIECVLGFRGYGGMSDVISYLVATFSELSAGGGEGGGQRCLCI